jgi:hypothetical protein
MSAELSDLEAQFDEVPRIRKYLELHHAIEQLRAAGFELVGLQVQRANGELDTIDLDRADMWALAGVDD